jgi:hypothetical protein
MKINNAKKIAIIGYFLFFHINTASALGQVSRACQFYTIPSSLKMVAAAFFYAVGANADVFDTPNSVIRYSGY